MASRGSLESYLLEILARARSAQERCDFFLSYDYISRAPKDLAHAISRICSYLADAAVAIFSQIDWEDAESIRDDEQMLRLTDNLIQELAAHLRYVEGARTERLPWGIILSFEKLVGQLVPDKQVMLRPKWNYNYSVTAYDFRDHYLRALRELRDYLPTVDLEGDVIASLELPFYIIAFPSLERENILLHTLLGHEIGHLFVQRFLTAGRVISFKEAVMSRIEGITDQEMLRDGVTEAKAGALFWSQMRKDRIARNASLTARYWIRALEETLADIVGAILFGPAALFSTLEMAMQQGFDIAPSPQNSFYPPWRMRLREVFRIVEGGSRPFFPIDAALFRGPAALDRQECVNEKYRLIKELVEDRRDFDSIIADPITKLAYEAIETVIHEGANFFIKECGLGKKGRRISPNALYKHMRVLLNRLDGDIPPNALEEKINDRRQVNFVEIINAAWLHRSSLASPVLREDGTLDQGLSDQRRRVNKLTLKAVEFSGLANNYWKENRIDDYAPDQREVRAGKDGREPSVLSASEIVEYMERVDLGERLIVTPLLNPRESIGVGAVDVRLGNQFIVMKREAFPLLDVGRTEAVDLDIEKYQEKAIKPYREKFILHPRQLVIGSTLEYIQIPPDLMCYVIGKSTWGRMGLIIATATKVDPGFRGCITLEIINEGEIPLVLYPGIPIAQLVLHRTSGRNVYTGHYNCAIGPEFPKFGGKGTAWSYWTRPND